MDLRRPSWQTKLASRVGNTFRSNKSYTQESIDKNAEKDAKQRQKQAEKYAQGRTMSQAASKQDDVNELGERKFSAYSQASTLIDNKDHTDLLHGLAHHDSFDSLVDSALMQEKLDLDTQDPNLLEKLNKLMELRARQLARLSDEIWKLIASFLTPSDAASLAMSSHLLLERLGYEPLAALQRAENTRDRISFLNYLDRSVPRHLLCFPCAKFHLRSKAGKESLKADYVANPLFSCPKARDTVLPRMRLTHGRELPYAYVQLTVRGHRLSDVHGIRPESLSRRWKCKDSGWSHRTRYMINDGHLLLRVVSQSVTLPGAEMTETRMRHLLYDRQEYIPFFSVCAHWKDGQLMRVCKCAISHVPSPPETYTQQLKKGPKISRAAANPSFMVRGCGVCRPMRRCPECPSEYLVEIQMVEDKEDPFRPFKHAIVVTRWTDLGNGTSPYTSPEWVAINRANAGNLEDTYDSNNRVGRRALSGIFESGASGSVSLPTLLSLNPKNERLGEDGDDWY